MNHLFMSLALLVLQLSPVGVRARPLAPLPPVVTAALQAMSPGVTLQDITLRGNVTYFGGSHQETGTFLLQARGGQESALTLSLSDSSRQEVRNGPTGYWAGSDGQQHAIATHNCWVDAVWFFPALSLAASTTDSTLAILSVGQELHEGQPTYHLTLLHTVAGQTPDVVASIQLLSTMDLYLDAGSLLPLALDFNMHPDDAANLNIPTEIRFAGYQSFNGVLVPTHIQKYMQNALIMDFIITSANVNSGIPDSVFALPPAITGGTQ
jgi:hypothetical protein